MSNYLCFDAFCRHLAYTGLAFVLIGVVGAIIGIILCVILYKIYQRINEGGGKMKKVRYSIL